MLIMVYEGTSSIIFHNFSVKLKVTWNKKCIQRRNNSQVLPIIDNAFVLEQNKNSETRNMQSENSFLAVKYVQTKTKTL